MQINVLKARRQYNKLFILNKDNNIQKNEPQEIRRLNVLGQMNIISNCEQILIDNIT